MTPNQHNMQHDSAPAPRKFLKYTSAAAIIGAGLLLSACAGSNDDATGSPIPVEGGPLRLDGPADAGANPCLDPFQGWGSDWTLLSSNIAERLVDQDPETGEIVPWLATEWTVSDDGLDYTFQLREDVTFSDGEEFNAEAVKTAYDNAGVVVDKTGKTIWIKG